MADTDDNDLKIKELEESLARELDQMVKLTEPTDSRLTGAVDLNPDLSTTANASTKPQSTTYEPVPKSREPDAPQSIDESAKKEVAEVSLEDLDGLLNSEMPELQAELNSLRDAGQELDGTESAITGLDVSEEGVVDGETVKKKSFKLRVKDFFTYILERFTDFLYELPIKTYRYLVKFFKEDFLGLLKRISEKTKKTVDSFVATIKELTIQQKLIILAMLLISGAIVFLLISNLTIQSLAKDPFLTSFDHLGQKYTNGEENFIPLSEEGQYPEFVVLIEKIVVNLRPSENSSSNPMVAMRLYFEVSSREGAIEMKDREHEMRDLIQRTIEKFSYDQVVSAQGKKSFKEALRREISSIMNTGIIKNVFIDDILIKP